MRPKGKRSDGGRASTDILFWASADPRDGVQSMQLPLSSSLSLRASPPHLLPVTNNDTKFDFAIVSLFMSPDGDTPEWATSHQVLGTILEFRRGQSGLTVMYVRTLAVAEAHFQTPSITLWHVPMIYVDTESQSLQKGADISAASNAISGVYLALLFPQKPIQELGSLYIRSDLAWPIPHVPNFVISHSHEVGDK